MTEYGPPGQPAPPPGEGSPYQPRQQPPPHAPPHSPLQQSTYQGFLPAPPGPPPLPRPAGAPDTGSAVPGWMWPLLVVTALVAGLVGGLLGGAAVLGTASVTDPDPLPELGAAPPLTARNGSVATVAQTVLPSTVQVRVRNGPGADTTGATGSGFVVDRQRHVITNNHVVAVAEEDGVIDVVDVEGRVHRAEVVGRSPVYDIAVLSVTSRRGLEPASLGSSRQLRVGDTVVAIGSPLGLTSTVTSGIVSAVDRPVTTGTADASSFINAVQTDAAINPGNSGGPLVNLRGQVVGVNSAIATTGGSLGGQSGNIGVGFAIPMEQVRITARQILTTGRAQYPVIGASVDTSEGSTGAVVTEVPADSPAAEAGIRSGDRIVAVADTRVTNGIALIVAIRTHRPGERVAVTLVRDGEQRTVQVTLDAKVG